MPNIKMDDELTIHPHRSIEIGPSSSFHSLRKALLAVQQNQASSAVVAHIDRDQTNLQTPSILAVYIKSVKEAEASGDPIRATLQTSIVEDGSNHSGVVIMGEEEHNEEALLRIIQSVLTVDEREHRADARTLDPSGGHMRSFEMKNDGLANTVSRNRCMAARCDRRIAEIRI